MNGDLLNKAVVEGKTLQTTLAKPTPAARVEALYSAALGRLPQPSELQRALRHVEAGGDNDKAQRYGDVFWALLNSLEFRTNH